MVAPELTLDDPNIESTERSAEAVTMPTIPVETVLLLSDGFASDVDEVIVAVLLIVPEEALGNVFTESVKFVSS